MSRGEPFHWELPEERFLPQDSNLWLDGKACHTKFQQDPEQKNYQTVQMEFEWKHGEEAVKSVSFVLLEQGHNEWHNNNGKDYHIEFDFSKHQESEKEHHAENHEPHEQIQPQSPPKEVQQPPTEQLEQMHVRE